MIDFEDINTDVTLRTIDSSLLTRHEMVYQQACAIVDNNDIFSTIYTEKMIEELYALFEKYSIKPLFVKNDKEKKDLWDCFFGSFYKRTDKDEFDRLLNIFNRLIDDSKLTDFKE